MKRHNVVLYLALLFYCSHAFVFVRPSTRYSTSVRSYTRMNSSLYAAPRRTKKANEKIRRKERRVVSDVQAYSERDAILQQLIDAGANAIEIIEHLTTSNTTNERTYTNAIQALAHDREAAFEVFQLMEYRKVQPSPFTFSALFQATDGTADALDLQTQLIQDYPETNWTVPVLEAAILACSREEQPSWSSIWNMVQDFVRDNPQRNLSSRLFSSLLDILLKLQDENEAAKLLQYMVENGYRILASHWSLFLQFKQGADIIETFRHMQSMEQEINVRHCTIAMRRFNDATLARDLLLYMSGQPISSAFEGLTIVKPDRIAVLAALAACNDQERFDISMEILNSLKQDLIDRSLLDSTVYNEVLVSCSDPEIASSLVREMRLTRRHRYGATPPTQKTYTRAIAVCRRAKDVQTALHLLERAHDDGIPLDAFMYSAAIWTAAEASAASVAERLFTEMKVRGIDPNIVSFDGLIAAHANAGNFSRALELYFQLLNEGLAPTRTTFIYLSRAIRLSPYIEDRLRKLQKVYESAVEKGCEGSILSPIAESLIRSSGALGKYDAAKSVFKSLAYVSMQCLRGILYACSVSKPPRWEDALVFLHSSDVSFESQSPRYVDPESLSLAVITCSRANQWEDALQILDLYSDTPISLHAANCLLSACGRSGRADMSLEILNNFGSYGLTPDERSYRMVMIACNQAQHMILRQSEATDFETGNTFAFEYWEAAVSLLRRMLESGIVPDKQTYSSAISACEAAGQWQRALAILQSILDTATSEEDLTIYFFNACISACEKGEAWIEALEVYERMMADEGLLRPNKVTVSSLVLALDGAGQKELAKAKYEEAVEEGIVYPWKITRFEGDEVTALDLHTFNAGMALAAVRSHIDTVLELPLDSISDFHIITGKGLRSDGFPVLSPKVRQILKDEYGIIGSSDPLNEGRIVIPAEVLRHRASARL